MTTRDEWIDAGLTALAAEGIGAVRIDRLAKSLGVTQGSFHHHFAGAEEYRRCLLERYEADAGRAIADTLAAVTGLSPTEAVMALPHHARLNPRLDAALRGWAVEHDPVREVLTRVDRGRLDALTALWETVLTDRHQARIAALVPHLAIIGASVAIPPPAESELEELFELLAELVPAVPSAAVRGRPPRH